MSISYLKRYEITLETMGPVFIGNGESLLKKEWILDRRNKVGIIIDERKLFHYLKKRELVKEFEDFMLHDKRRLEEWMREKNIYPQDIGQIEKYRIDCSSLGNVNTDKGVMTFIKDAFGRPYIPGSSLKGAIRNVILAQMIRDEGMSVNRLRSEIPNSRRKRPKEYLKREASEIQEKYLHTRNLPEVKRSEIVNDCFSGMIIGDSEPLPYESLTMCLKVDVNIEGKETEIPLVRECLKPGTKIILSMVIDETKLAIDSQYIVTAIENFLEDYNHMFLSHFSTEDQYHGQVLYLGGGVGYQTKTISNQLFARESDRVKLISDIINETLNHSAKSKHQHFKDRNLGVSPHAAKVTDYDGTVCQFGPCRISICPI